MAYTSPSNRSTGDLITSSIWNQDIVANSQASWPDIATTAGDITYATAADTATRLAIGTAYYGTLKVNSGATAPAWVGTRYIIDVNTSETNVSNTTTKTTLYSVSVPGGLLSTNNVLIGRCVVSQLHNNGSLAPSTFQVDYGATTIITTGTPGSVGGSATTVVGTFEFHIKGDGATNSQEGQGWVYLTRGATAFLQSSGEGTAAIDSTSAQTLTVSVTHGSASTNITTTSKNFVLEAIPNT